MTDCFQQAFVWCWLCSAAYNDNCTLDCCSFVVHTVVMLQSLTSHIDLGLCRCSVSQLIECIHFQGCFKSAVA